MFAQGWQQWLKRTYRAFQGNGRSMNRPLRRSRLFLEGLEDRDAPATLNLSPVADNTLYQDPQGRLSNGAGRNFYVGATNQNANGIRRGAIRFDLSAIPAGSTVTSATLTLTMSKTISGAQSIALHRALQNWGEGTSNANAGGTGSGGGDGVPATINDVTWLFTFFNTQSWNTAGGDFAAAASATTSVAGVGSYQWSGAGLTADVQQWVNGPTNNFGWILTGNETVKPSAKQFDSKENPTPANRPVLTVNFNPPAADLTISKSHSGNFRQGDPAGTYTLTVNNIGSGPTIGPVTLTDVLPAGLTPTAANNGVISGWTVSTSGQTVTATRSDALAGAGNYPPLNLVVSVANNAPASVTNTATVSGGGDVNTANNSASDPTTIASATADLTLTKTHSSAFRPGDAAATYNLTANNIGAGPTVGAVTVTDTLPTGLTPTAANNGTINGWTVSTSGQTVTATRSDVLANGSSYPALTITVSVATNAPASVTNTATVAGGGEVNTANNSASDTTPIAPIADLTITKSHSGSFRQGDTNASYTLTVHNGGGGSTVGTVTVTDTLPTGLTPAASNIGTISGWTVSTSGQTVTATRADVLASGASYPALTLAVNVANNAPASVVNTATVVGGGEVITNNNSASDTSAITQVADLTVSKSHSGPFRQGDAAASYVLTVNNAGAGSTVGAVTLTDLIPTGLTPTSGNGVINGWTVSTNGQTVTATRSDVLLAGTSYPTLTLTVSVANDAPASVINTASVSGGGEVVTSNNSVSDPTSIGEVADLTIGKSHSGDFRQGGAGTYNLTVNNIGLGPTVGTVTLTDTFPAGLVPTAANNGAMNGWSVSTSGQTVTATRSDALAAGNSYPVLALTVQIASTAAPSMTNTATVAGGGELNTANNAASDPTAIGQRPDLAIAKSHVGAFHPGDTGAIYTIVVKNVGGAATDGSVVTVIDTLPTGLVPTAANSGTLNGWTVTTSGQTVTATRSDVLAGGASYPSLTVTVNVATTAPPSFVNTVTVAGGGDVNTANNTADDATSSTPVADLTISKSHAGDFRQGDAAATYTINVSNVATEPTLGAVTVTDTLPTGLTPTAADNGTINGWSVSFAGRVITATRNDVLAGGTAYPALTLTVKVADNAPANVINTVTVSGGGEVNTANNSVSDSTVIIPVADLTVSKSHSGTFRQGDSGNSYTLTVHNIGSGATTGVVTLTDTFPAGLTPTVGNGLMNGWTVTTSGQTVTATRSDVLASGGSFPALTLTVRVDDNAPASVINHAAVSGGGEVNAANSTANDPTTIAQVADLAIAKIHDGNFRQGDAAAQYTLTIDNVGPGPTVGAVTITDTLPNGLTPVAPSGGTINGWSVTFGGQTVTATRNDVLASGGSYPVLPLTVHVANDAPASLINTATVSGGGELNTANDSASDPTTIVQVADLTIGKNHSGSFRQGDAASTYTLTVNNIGPGPTLGAVTLTDTLPAGLTPTAANNGVINGWTVSTSGQTVTATRSDALAGGSSYPALAIVVAVSATAPASVTNVATVAGGGELNTANDSASDPTTITQLADLAIAKSHAGDFHPGDSADAYAITVSNVGPAPTDGSAITVIDTLPTGLMPTAANSGVINGWAVSTNGQTITATRNDVLASGAVYPTLTLTVRVADNAPANVVNTARVSGGGEVNLNNNSATDTTAITPRADLAISKSHVGDFRQGDLADTYTVVVRNVGPGLTEGAVTVIDKLPDGMTPTAADSGVFNGWTVSFSGPTITATRSDVLASGASYPPLIVTVNIADNAPASVTNSATVSGGGQVAGSNDTAFDVTAIQPGDLVRRRRGA